MKTCYHILLLVCSVSTVSSHLCLIRPRQRGDFDISKSGSGTCFRHGAPCGGIAPETPDATKTYKAGQTAFFQFQQNYNHYEPGYPGYMDLAIANSSTRTDFQTLAVFTDKYVHAQDNQHNYTVVLTIPNISCDHCVIRARYNAHKPGETPFLQCSDIKIVKSDSSHKTLRYLQTQQPPKDKHLGPLKRAMRLHKSHRRSVKSNSKGAKLYGFEYNPFDSESTRFVSIDTMRGRIDKISKLMFGVDSYGAKTTTGHLGFMLDEVVGIDNYENMTSVILHTTGGPDDTAKRLYSIGSDNGTLVREADLFQFKGGAINALSWYVGQSLAAIRLQPTDQEGNWDFEVGTLDYGGVFTMRAHLPKPENLYINFQWFETDVNNYNLVYALMGNENAPNQLNARIYTFDIYNGKYVGQAELDVSKFTFMSVQSYKPSNKLFAFSPGLWEGVDHAWYLVAVDPHTGNVTKQCDIAPSGIFERYYGGSVYQGYTKLVDQLLYHVLRVAGSDADIIVSVNPLTCDVNFSDVTNLRHMHSLHIAKPGGAI